MNAKEKKVVYLKYNDTATNTVATFDKPEDIQIDMNTLEWWQTAYSGSEDVNIPNWRGKTPIGENRLFSVHLKPGQVIGVYDYNDLVQRKVMTRDAKAALKKDR